MYENKARYVLIVIFSVLLILQLLNYDYGSAFKLVSLFGFLAPVLMIIAMMVSLNNRKNKDEN